MMDLLWYLKYLHGINVIKPPGDVFIVLGRRTNHGDPLWRERLGWALL